MNKVILMGRLTRDPEVRYSQGEGHTVTADFFNCTAFGKQGEFVEKYLKQGTKVVVTGRIQNDNYTNKEGQKVYSVQIIVEEIEFAESKNAAANNGGSFQNAPSGNGAEPMMPEDGFMNIPDGIDNSLPFQ